MNGREGPDGEEVVVVVVVVAADANKLLEGTSFGIAVATWTAGLDS